jgi:hypothetical protein
LTCGPGNAAAQVRIGHRPVDPDEDTSPDAFDIGSGVERKVDSRDDAQRASGKRGPTSATTHLQVLSKQQECTRNEVPTGE